MTQPRMRWTRLIYAIPLTVALTIAVGQVSAADQRLTPSHIAKVKSTVSAAISPDGRCVAYAMAVPRDPLGGENGPAWVELHVVDARGVSRPFVAGNVNVSAIDWTPDGRAITFVAKRGDDEYATLYAIPIDGGEARRLIDHHADLHGAVFSRDGRQVAFLATEPLSKKQQEYQDQGFNQEIYEEDWRPAKVWIAPVDGSEKPRAIDLPGSASQVRWSPSGKQLAVVLAPTALVDDGYMFKRLHLVDVETGKIIGRIANPGKLGQVAFSPDGKNLAMISGADIHDPKDGRLMVVATAGDGELRDLMPKYDAHVDSFAWQDDRTLLFVAGEGTSSRLGTVGLDGPQKTLVEPGGPVLSDVTLSQNGRSIAMLGQTPQHPSEVFLVNAGAKSPKRLTDANPWLAEIRLARQEVVEWKARDGLRLEGVLVYPVNYEEGRRYPLILAVHGGPEAHTANGWVTTYSRPGQTGAARGFAVFYPNYRGSTGRGVEFSKLGQADAAGREFDDLVDAVDHLVAVGLADKDKVGITGASYGGYASAWGATYYSHRFAASVMFVGISDNVSKIGTTDIPEEMYLVHHRKRLWDDWSYYIERSPIRHVEKNRTPTLILHGKSDPRVHPSQSMELYRHLKTLGQAPVRLVFYPGEGHGNRRAAARLDYNLRLLRWMEHYLQADGGDPPDYPIDYEKAVDGS